MPDIEKILSDLRIELKKINLLSNLTGLETRYLGRNGKINDLLKEITNIPAEQKKDYGKNINKLKVEVIRLIELKKSELVKETEGKISEDVTLPGVVYPHGTLHIVTMGIEEISQIFEKIGFIRVSYPEVEWEQFAFDALNMPKSHPARDDFETFFIDVPENKQFGKMVLSPHTSSGQIREMQRAGKPPIRMINVAKTYRPNWDVTHTPMFHQFEGLCIDKNINITHLKGTIDYFAKQFFGQNRETRLRPHHFQFTEPSFEVDITCGVCLGKGEVNGIKCRICKSGWLELAGAGMVHPNVLRAGNIDPEVYTGWAFGFGIERPLMMKEDMKIEDMRLMYNGDIRFLEQF